MDEADWEEIQGTSPVPHAPSAPKLLSFYEAIAEIMNDNIVGKEEWDPDITVFMDEDRLKINLKGKIHDWLISRADIESDDYKVINNEANAISE